MITMNMDFSKEIEKALKYGSRQIENCSSPFP